MAGGGHLTNSSKPKKRNNTRIIENRLLRARSRSTLTTLLNNVWRSCCNRRKPARARGRVDLIIILSLSLSQYRCSTILYVASQRSSRDYLPITISEKLSKKYKFSIPVIFWVHEGEKVLFHSLFGNFQFQFRAPRLLRLLVTRCENEIDKNAWFACLQAPARERWIILGRTSNEQTNQENPRTLSSIVKYWFHREKENRARGLRETVVIIIF